MLQNEIGKKDVLDEELKQAIKNQVQTKLDDIEIFQINEEEEGGESAQTIKLDNDCNQLRDFGMV